MMKTPPIVSQEEWEAARRQLLVKEKELTRARDTLAAERRRMPLDGPGPQVARTIDRSSGCRRTKA